MLSLETRSLRLAGVSALGIAAALALPGHDPVACPLRAVTGVPCPFCGMTRGVAHALRGDLVGAIALNPGSLLLVAGVIVLVAMWRRPTIRLNPWIPIAVVIALWIYQLCKYATGRPL